jgi:glucan phosphorylase
MRDRLSNKTWRDNMEILSYSDQNLDAPSFQTLINKTRKANKDRWYAFVGNVEGKQVSLKGFNTWLQRYTVDGLHQPNTMDISVKQFNDVLINPFTR